MATKKKTTKKKATKKKAAKRPEGRPSDYKPEYCQMLIEHMKNANPFKTFGAIVGVCETTLHAWTKKYPEFLKSKKIGTAKGEHNYVQVVKGQMLGTKKKNDDGTVVDYSKGNTTALIWFGKNVYGWRDNPEPVDDDAPDGIEFV